MTFLLGMDLSAVLIICDFLQSLSKYCKNPPFLMELSPPANPAGLALNRDSTRAASAASISTVAIQQIHASGLQNAGGIHSSLIFFSSPMRASHSSPYKLAGRPTTRRLRTGMPGKVSHSPRGAVSLDGVEVALAI